MRTSPWLLYCCVVCSFSRKRGVVGKLRSVTSLAFSWSVWQVSVETYLRVPCRFNRLLPSQTSPVINLQAVDVRSPLFYVQVALFLEALFSRCAADVLAGLGEEESPPLRLLTDASFYEMEAVAQSGGCQCVGGLSWAVFGRLVVLYVVYVTKKLDMLGSLRMRQLQTLHSLPCVLLYTPVASCAPCRFPPCKLFLTVWFVCVLRSMMPVLYVLS